MPLNELFLPLLGGYIFFSWFNGTKYRAAAFPAQRLIFPCAALGLGFFCIAKWLEVAFDHLGRSPELWTEHAIGRAVPVAAFSILLAMMLTWIVRIEAVGNAVVRCAPFLQPSITQVGSNSDARLQSFAAAVGASALIYFSYAASGKHLYEFTADCLIYATIAEVILVAATLCLSSLTRWPVFGLFFRLSVVLVMLTCIAGWIVVRPSDVPKAWMALSPTENLTTPALALGIGVLAPFLCNLVITPFAAAGFQFLSGRMNELQALFFDSLIHKTLIVVTLQDSKVYIGWVESAPAQTELTEGYFRLQPLLSGFRDKDTRELVVKTKYGAVYARLSGEAESTEDLRTSLRPFQKVIPIRELRYAGPFDEEYFASFNEEESDLGDRSG